MSATIPTQARTDENRGEPQDEPRVLPGADDDVVEVRRDGPLAGVVGVASAGVAVAYLLRAAGTGTTLDWLVCAVFTVLAGLHLAAFADSRAPLLVMDRHGVRLRRGTTWEGAAWPDVDRIEHNPRTSMLRDGRLCVVTTDERTLAIRLSLSTQLIGAGWHELTDVLLDLSDGRTEILVPETDAHVEPETPGQSEEDDDDLVPAAAIPSVVLSAGLATSPTPAPEREVRAARRSDVVLAPREAEPAPEGSQPANETVTLVFGDAVGATGEPDPVADPVIGPQLRAARTRLGLDVDQLAERTRIRPHVIEAIEVDDFAPCGGDFYARGHLRTLARVLGVEAGPLVESYDERYATAPVDPRAVFEAELATGTGSIRGGSRGGTNWSVLVAAVMAVVLVWSVARLLMDDPAPLADAPVLNGSGGAGGGKASLTSGSTETVRVEFTAATSGATVIVRDGRHRVVFKDQVPFLQTARVDAVPPISIQSTDGGLTVEVDGDDEGALGETGRTANRVFVPESN